MEFDDIERTTDDPTLWRLLAAELEATRAEAAQLESVASTAQAHQQVTDEALIESERQLASAQAQIDDLSAHLTASQESYARLQAEHATTRAKLQRINRLFPRPLKAVGRRILRLCARLFQRATR